MNSPDYNKIGNGVHIHWHITQVLLRLYALRILQF